MQQPADNPASFPQINPSLLERISDAPGTQIPATKAPFQWENLDIFGRTPQLTWNRKSRYQTKFGVMLTILFTALAVGCSWLFMIEFIFCMKPAVRSKNIYEKISATAEHNDLMKTNFPSITFLTWMYLP
jgi:hypothetical protein